MQNNMIKGSIILIISSLVSKLLGAIYRIPLARILGEQGMGLYQLVFPIYSALLVFVTSGISVTISKKVAEFRVDGDYASISRTTKYGYILALVLGVFFAGAMFLFRNILAQIQGNLQGATGYVALSIGFAFACVISVYRGYFQGFENMLPTAVSQVVEQFTKLVLGLVLAVVLSRRSLSFAVFGALIGVSVGEILAWLVLMIMYKISSKHTVTATGQKNFFSLKNFVSSALPISLYNVITPLGGAVDSLIVVNILAYSGFAVDFATRLFGVYGGMVMPIINIPIIFVSAIMVCLLPKVSYLNKQKINQSGTIGSVAKVVLAIALPCCVGIMILSENIVTILYPQTVGYLLESAVNLFNFLAIYLVFATLSSLATTVLQAMGHFRYPLAIMLLGEIIKIVLTLVLLQIPSVNIVGLAIAQTLSCAFVCILNIIKLKHLLNFSLKRLDITKIFLSTAIMGCAVYGIFCTIKNIYLSTIFSVATGVVVYSCMIVLTKTFRFANLKLLK